MRLIDLVREVTPKFNEDVARGYACKEISISSDSYEKITRLKEIINYK